MVTLSVIVALIGNIISILVFLSPVSTFTRIIKKKSIENFKGISYVCTLLSTSLWTLYGLLKPGGFLVATVNGAGAFLQALYVTLYIIYAPRDIRIKYLKIVGLLNIGCLGVVAAIVFFAFHGGIRITILGFICAGLTLGMYGSPLGAMRSVIKTRSVEFMPFFLSFFLFLNAGVWSTYAVLVKDFFIGVPNAIGLLLGSAQLLLWVIYNNKTSVSTKSMEKLEEEGSAHLVHGDLEMGQYKDIEKKERNLSKGVSLPKSYMTVARQNSIQKIVKTRSLLTPYELQSDWPVEEDDVKNNQVNGVHH
ncbi:hypothetical protein ACHQM5_026664 [Ranunculus cassubicifolius]